MHSSTATKPAHTAPNVPLARDANGQPIALPPEAAFWRVRRHTRGRPRNVAGVDRAPLKLPLDFTEDDLHNMLGDGAYRLDLHDEAGQPLDLTVTVALGEPDAENENALPPSNEITSVLPVSASDMRLVLEANVRATQMAFQHNERTLTASLRMADTLRDGIRDLASAQASWITSISSARGFFRNAPPLQLAAPRDDDKEDDGVDGDDEIEAEAGEPAAPGVDWVKMLQPVVGMVTQQAVSALMGIFTKPGSASDIFANALDWRRAEAQRAAPKPTAAQPPPPAEPEKPPAKDIQDQLVDKAIAIGSFLTPAEQTRLVAMMPKLMTRANDPELVRLVGQLMPLSPQDGADWVRANVDMIEQRFAS